ncbi:MAG: DUF1566 domain-containing protein [Anaerolineae bacterium]|jgi:hypothetical protein|nr:DUF1566 domain-containing protein [Anaerolineae bacterium]MBT7071712.1 DUF1566 domain-containing protein [Anaerolineae bacterium]MBT7325238.1 DUF1566 domain-containing protein [Anaerolineae bacterium]
MKDQNKSKRIGRIAVGFSILITSLWAFWGAGETFHEGWYYENFMMNISLTIIQYLSPMLIFMGIGITSIYWPRVGAAIHVVVAILAAWFFNIFSNTVIIFILMPLVLLGLFYWYGSPPPRKTALQWMIGLPIIVGLVVGSVPAYRVSQRIKDRSSDAQLVEGNEITLTWAPSGPGWPREGINWHEAVQICQLLDQDGKTLAAEPQNIWRLPTVDEAVRSMALHGENSRGVWNAQKAEASYEKRPDKEFPLWDSYSQVIYWWTSTEVDQKNAYIIVYDGKVWPRSKELDMGYLGFRCVK